ncbi:MAG: FHA domain-containing protein, partial [Anaerolineae bacterium]|nr:FHA domain-containing protein [Anaerolineae bacterium]
ADGILVAQNTSEPYDEFVWDLRSCTQDSEHHLVAEATDNLGMIGKSSEVTVRIIVPSPTQGMMAAVTQKRPLIVAAFVIILASLLVLVLIVGGHIRPKPHPGQRKPPLKNGQKSKTVGDRLPSDRPGIPLSGPKDSSQMPDRPAVFHWMQWFDRLPWRKQKPAPTPAIAYLIPLAGYDEPSIPARLEIIDHDVSLGSDPRLVSMVFEDASVAGVHARIHHEGHAFTITDNNTVAGTWVNYIQALPTGTTLEHMDIIHLGKIGFRFQLTEPGQLRRINVTPLEQHQ